MNNLHKSLSWSLLFTILLILLSNSVFAVQYLSSCKTSGWISGETYILTADVSSSGTCMQIDANNVTLNCQGYTINYGQSSNYSYGIYSIGYNNSYIKNCKIVQNNTGRGYVHGIYFAGSSGNKVENVSINIIGNYSGGIRLDYSWPNSAQYNIIRNVSISMSGVQGYGLWFYGSNSNNISNVSITTSGYNGDAIRADSSSDSNNNIFTNMTVRNIHSISYSVFFRGNNNLFYNNLFNSTSTSTIFILSGSNYWNKTLTSGSNIVNGSYIGGNFYATPSGTGFSQTCTDSNADGVCDQQYSIDSNNIDYLPLAVPPIELTACGTLNQAGRTYVLTTNVSSCVTCFTIAANNVTLDCQGYTITHACSGSGVYVPSSYATIKNCNIIGNLSYVGSYGIDLDSGSNNTLINNNFSNHDYGIYIYGSSNNNISNNTVSNNHGGLQVRFGINNIPSSNNNIHNNNILNNTYAGIYLSSFDPTNNTIFNNFFNNTQNVRFDGTTYQNFWNTTLDCSSGPNIIGGSCIGGNFWATPAGDGFSQTCTDSNYDGICDSNFAINSNNIDYLPLTIPPIELTACGTLNQAGRTYVLKNNVSSSGTCFTIAANNLTLDCQGYTINYSQTSGGNGVNVTGYNLTTIKNCIIKQINPSVINAYGIYLINSSNGSFMNNTLITYHYGFEIAPFSNYNYFGYNNVTSNSTAVDISFDSNYSTFTFNTFISNSSYGMHLYACYNTNISNNNIQGKDYGVYLDWADDTKLVSNNITSTTSNGIYGRYLDRNIILYNNITANNIGISIDGYYNNVAYNNILSTNSFAIELASGDYSNFTNNIIRSINNIDFISSFALSNRIVNMTFNGTEYSSTVSFTYSGAIQIDSADAVPSPGYYNVSKYLNITNTSSGTLVRINFSYSNDTIGENETKLKLYRWDGSKWNEVPGSGVDIINKIVYANITQFSIFSPLAVADATPPSIQLISPANNTYTNDNNMTFVFNATDDQSSTFSCSLYINNVLNQTNSSVVNGSLTSFSLTNIADGDYSWYINCSDASGNWNVSETRNFTIDTIYPSITIISPQSNAFLNNRTITINLTVIENNVNYTNISILNGSNIINSTISYQNGTFTVQLSVPSDGVYNITTTTYDATNKFNSSSIYNVTIDTINPSITIISPSSNSYLNSKLITINGTSLDTNLNYTNISIYQGSKLINSTITTDTSWSVQLSVPSDGIYNITATAYDNATNSNISISTSVTVDTINPYVLIISPLQSNPVFIRSGVPVSVEFNYTETNPENYTVYLINSTGEIVNSKTVNGLVGGDSVPVSDSISTDGLPSGNYSINITIYDKVNQMYSTSEQNSVVIDNEIPGIIIHSPSNNQHILGDKITVNLTVYDDNLNYTNISLYNSSNDLIDSTVLSTAGNYIVEFTVPQDGIYSINVTAFDVTNNNATASVSGVSTDNNSPFYISSCLNFTLPGEYILTQNIYSINTTCIIITSNNLLLEGQGNQITNLGSPIVPGIYAENLNNVTIQNLIMQNYEPDIEFINMTNSNIINVTHNGGQLHLLGNINITVSSSNFLNSETEGVVIENSSEIYFINTSIKNSKDKTVSISSSNVTFSGIEIESRSGIDSISISGERQAILISNSSINANSGNAIVMNVAAMQDTTINISDSIINNSNNVIYLTDPSGIQSKNIQIKAFKNNILNFNKAVASSIPVNASGTIFLTDDVHGNYWGRNNYPYLNESDMENASSVNDEYPYKSFNGWMNEARFRLNSSSYVFNSKDRKLTISMPYSAPSYNNLILSRLENEVFVIEQKNPLIISAENSLVNGSLHYNFGTYSSIYLPDYVEDRTPIVTPQPIEFTFNFTDLSEEEVSNATLLTYDQNNLNWPYEVAVFDSTQKIGKSKLYTINGSIELAVGKKLADLISLDNISPTVSLSQQGSIIVASYNDPLINITQSHNGIGETEINIVSDTIVPFYLPLNALINSSSIKVSPLSGSPSFTLSVYMRNGSSSDLPAMLYYSQEFNSLSEPAVINITYAISNAMSNCSSLNLSKGAYCQFYFAINGLSNGTLKLSDYSFNYSYASGIKLPDANTSGSVYSLLDIPNAENDSVYLMPGGSAVLLVSIPYKAYIKSAQITFVGEQGDGSYPSDVSFWIGNGSTVSQGATPIITYNGQLNTSVQVIAPFVNAINNFISQNEKKFNKEYILPLTFNSSTEGIIHVTSITIEYDLRNAYDESSPSYIEVFSDGSSSKELVFTPSTDSHLVYINIPKYAKVSNITLAASPSESITFDIDFLNDGTKEIINSSSVNALNLTSYLQTCNASRFIFPYGKVCTIPINITANLGNYSSVSSSFEPSANYISVSWPYAGSDSEVIRGSMRKYDFLSIPSSAKRGMRNLNLEHHSIYSLQNGDVVIGYALDMAGNMGSNQYTYTVTAPQQPSAPPVETLQSLIPISGFMNCTNQVAYVITEPGASVTVLYKSTGKFVAGGNADSNGRFEFMPPISGDYTIRASKTGFQDNSITLTAKECLVQAMISTKKVLDCSSGSCSIKLVASSNKISDIQIKLTDYIPKNIIKSVNTLLDRYDKRFFSYSYTDSIISIPPTQTITSTFSVLIDTFITSISPIYNEKENKLTFTINNPAADVSVDEITIPLPENVRGKEIQSIEYIAADGSKMNITDYVVESDKIVVKQQITVKKS